MWLKIVKKPYFTGRIVAWKVCVVRLLQCIFEENFLGSRNIIFTVTQLNPMSCLVFICANLHLFRTSSKFYSSSDQKGWPFENFLEHASMVNSKCFSSGYDWDLDRAKYKGIFDFFEIESEPVRWFQASFRRALGVLLTWWCLVIF